VWERWGLSGEIQGVFVVNAFSIVAKVSILQHHIEGIHHTN
jgi:hypothetical protein